MEIPYIVNARKDTGLNNSKIAIWLFLASEVMLFGGLFSSYIFLRIYADYPWPERALPVLPGLVNTFILIASSVTVVFAWASLKLLQWRKFVGYMSFTLVCAVVFMVLKGFEYNAKLHHQSIQYNDWTSIEGHTHYDENKKADNYYTINATSVAFDLGSYYEPYLDSITPSVVSYLSSFEDRVTAKKQDFLVKLLSDKNNVIHKNAENSPEGKVLLDLYKAYQTGLNYLERKKANALVGSGLNDSVPSASEEEEIKKVAMMSNVDLLKKSKEILALSNNEIGLVEKTILRKALGDNKPISSSDKAKVLSLLKSEGYQSVHLKESLIINDFDGDKVMRIPLVKQGEGINLEGDDEGSLRYILELAKESFIESRRHNEQVRESALRKAWANVKGNDLSRFNAVDELTQYDKAKKEAATEEAAAIVESGVYGTIVPNVGALEVVVDGAEIKITPSWGKMSVAKQGEKSMLKLKDQTVIRGIAGDSGISIDVDAVDHRHLVMKARDRNYSQEKIDEMIEDWYKSLGDSKGAEKLREHWVSHKKWRELWATYLKDEYGPNEDGEPKRVPTDVEWYRVTWKHMVAYEQISRDKDIELSLDTVKQFTPGMVAGFVGANHGKYNPVGDDGKVKESERHFPVIHVAREDIRFESVFSPKMNNYYAIYFTVTGLHGLHVIGGALVLGYYLFFGYGMYKENPEWLANRVEVGGLFWHFVDLVWIFVFPIFYLM